jgi:hypothetical protein
MLLPWALLESFRIQKQSHAWLGTDRAKARQNIISPSSPSIALLQKGELVHIIERFQIERRAQKRIAGELVKAFDKFLQLATGAETKRGAEILTVLFPLFPRCLNGPSHHLNRQQIQNLIRKHFRNSG